MRNVLFGIGIALLFIAALAFGFEAWRVEKARMASIASYQWLSEPVLEIEGKKYSRAQVLDLIMVKTLNGNTQEPPR